MEEMVEEIGSSSSLKFSFDGLEVPLDLILQVIDEKGLDIKTFKVAEITDQYLKYVEEMEELDMEEANEVTTLLHVIGDVERISDHACNLLKAGKEIH